MSKLTFYLCRGVEIRVIVKQHTAYFCRLDLERLINSNLYSKTFYIKYQYKGNRCIDDFIRLEHLPALAFWNESSALYEIFDFYASCQYPQLRLHWFKNYCLKTYLFFFGKDKR